ncbi:hypothetical protein Tco_1563182 [Tanacetum coccineum]
MRQLLSIILSLANWMIFFFKFKFILIFYSRRWMSSGMAFGKPTDGFNDGAWFGSNVAASSFCDNNVIFGNLEVFGLKGSPPRAVLMGKKEMQKLCFCLLGVVLIFIVVICLVFLSLGKKRFRNRQLADKGVATDNTGCNSVRYEGVTSTYIDLGTAPETTYEEPF